MGDTDKVKVGISIGDPHGVGIEIILKLFQDKRMFDFFTPIVYGSTKLLIKQREHFDYDTPVCSLTEINSQPQKKQLNVTELWKETHHINFGVVSEVAGKLAVKSLEAATEALIKNEVDILVTAPIHKKAIQSETFQFSGHTDYLASRLEGESLMFLISDTLKVALATDHIPLKKVSDTLTPKLLEHKIDLLIKSLKIDFDVIRPKIAVLGINPHNGDHGVIGDEDERIIGPVVQEHIKSGAIVYGPYAADSFFGTQKHLQFDAVLAMYHDQGLIPFKTLSFGTGVNFTAGLNKVRTSPDHGTAFDIAGKDKADPESFREALFIARTIFKNRQVEKG